MTTKPVPLTAEQIAMLRDALNLAAEYSADIDDPEHYDEDDLAKLNAKIDQMRQLDNYLRQFEAQTCSCSPYAWSPELNKLQCPIHGPNTTQEKQ